MSGLSNEDCEALAVAARSTNLAVSDLQLRAIEATVEAIVARRVTAALTEAADAIEADATSWQHAARIVRALIPTDSATPSAPTGPG